MDNQTEEQVKNQQGAEGQNDSNKDKKKFQDGFKRMMAMLNGDESLFKAKVQGGAVPGLIAKLTAKRREDAEKLFIEKASALLDKKVAFDKECRQKRDEFEKAIATKEKEFLKEMNDVFGLIDSFGDIQKAYAETLGNLAGEEQQAAAGDVNA